MDGVELIIRMRAFRSTSSIHNNRCASLFIVS